MFKGTNKTAYKIASEEKTKAAKSKRYYKEKAKLEAGPSIFKSFRGFNFALPKNIYQVPKVQIKHINLLARSTKPKEVKFVEKKLILDDIRNATSSKIVSNISNNFAIIIAKSFNKELTNQEMNELRSVIALATSLVVENELREVKDAVEKIELFINICDKIYKIVCWLDKIEKTYKTDEKNIIEVSNTNTEYNQFANKYKNIPKIKIDHNIETNHIEEKIQYYTLFELWDIHQTPFLATDGKSRVKIYKSPNSYENIVYGYLCCEGYSNYRNADIWYANEKKWIFIRTL